LLLSGRGDVRLGEAGEKKEEEINAPTSIIAPEISTKDRITLSWASVRANDALGSHSNHALLCY